MNLMKLAETLVSPYRDLYEEAYLYQSLAPLPEDQAEDTLLNLHDLLYTAQLEGRGLGQILSDKDQQAFLQTYFGVSKPFMSLGQSLLNGLSWLLLIESLTLIMGWLLGQATDQVNLTPHLCGLVVGQALTLPLTLLYRWRQTRPGVSVQKFYVMSFVVFLLAFLPVPWLSSHYPLLLPMAWVWPMAGLVSLVIGGYKLYQTRRTYGTWGKPSRRLVEEFYKAGKPQRREEEQRRLLAKQLLKKVERFKTKGKDVQLVYQGLNKTYRQNQLYLTYLPHIFLGFYLLALLPLVFNSSWLDSLIYAALQAGVLYLFYRLNVKTIVPIQRIGKDILTQLAEQPDQLEAVLTRISQGK